MVDGAIHVARVARAIARHKLEAVLIGNAAAALHGAPVTTVDIDFLIRRARTNRKKLAAIAADLRATAFSPYYPVSRVTRLMNDDESLQIDFIDEAHGVKSFEGIRRRARRTEIDGSPVYVASLADIIKMKKATNRARDRAVLEILEQTLEAITSKQEGTPGTAPPTK